MPTRHVVIPLKDFTLAKSRLRVSGHTDTTTVVQQLAEGVLRACAPLPCTVVTESRAVASFAAALGAEVIITTATDLNSAVTEARNVLRSECDQLIVVHGDLRDPHGLGTWSPGPGVTIVTDHHGTGTNVLALDSTLPFTFLYGTNSAQQHEAEARRLDQRVTIVRDSAWSFDVDEITDLEK